MNTIQAFKTKLVLRLNKKKADGKAPIAVRIHLPHKSRAKYEFFTTNIRIMEKDWDAEKEKVRGKENGQLNHRLNEIVTKINNHLTAEQASGIAEPENIAAALKGKSVVRAEFFAFAKKHFEDMTGIADTTRLFYLRHLGAFQKFYGKDKLPFKEANTELFKKYIQSQERNGASASSIKSRMFVVKSAIASAINKGIIPPNNFISKELKVTKKESKTIKIKYLKGGDLDKFINLPLHKDKRIQAYRDTFALAATTGGLSWANVVALKWEDIKHSEEQGHYVFEKIVRPKTGAHLPKILIGPKAKLILERYGQVGKSKGFIFFKVFKIDEAKYNNPKTKTYIVRNVGDSCTRYLNRLAKQIGRQEGLTFHQARHTWATMALSSGMRIEIVSKILGHKKISTTQIYAQIVEEASFEAQIKFLEGFDKPKQKSEN